MTTASAPASSEPAAAAAAAAPAAAAPAPAAAAPAPAAAAPAAAPADERYGAPENYTVPKEAGEFPEELQKDLHTTAKELNLSEKSVHKLYSVAAKHAVRTDTALKSAHETNLKTWSGQTAADAEFGGEKLEANRAVAAKGLETFATPELRQIWKESGLENHPEFFRFAYRVGKAVSEDKFVGGGNQNRGENTGLFTYGKSDHK